MEKIEMMRPTFFLKKEKNVEDSYKKLINTIELLQGESKNPPKPHLDDYISDISYITPQRLEYQRSSYKNGQRKLFNALLQFMNQYHELANTVVYIGAAPGYNIQVVAFLFPNHTFHLYDMDNMKAVGPNIRIHQGRVSVHTVFPPAPLLLFSDIRDVKHGNLERAVENDQQIQKEIIERLLPEAYSLKFRIPFYTNKIKTSEYEYLYGYLCIQPYTGRESTEVRLMYDLKGANPKLRKYSLSDHENRAFCVNNVYREWVFYRTHNGVKGGDNCFDCALEESICSDYMKLTAYHKFQDVSQLRNYITQSSPYLSLTKGANELHGTLPLLRRDVRTTVKLISLMDIVINVYHNFIMFDKKKVNKESIRVWLTLPGGETTSNLEEVFTHKTTDPYHNYEDYEFHGDPYLGAAVSQFIKQNIRGSIHAKSSLYNYLTGRHALKNIFDKELKISRYLSAHEDLRQDPKIIGDVIEAFIGFTREIFDVRFKDGQYFVDQLVDSVLKKIDFLDEEFKCRVFPKKTALKEQLDLSKFTEEYSFEELFKTKREKGTNRVIVTIQAPLNKSAQGKDRLVELVRLDKDGNQDDVEAEASSIAREQLIARGYPPPPKVNEEYTII